MIKNLIIFTIALIVISAGNLAAEDYIGIGAHFGLHPNAGQPDSFDPFIQVYPQNNYFLGFSFKTNFLFLFSRFGVDTTFLINKGEVQDNSATDISYTKINYISIPFFLGYNYKLLDVGNFYLGPGFSYFISRGSIGTTAGAKDLNASGWGYGFLAGIEYKLTDKLNFYFEWEYLNGRSEPVVQSRSALNYEDFYVDYTGHRIIFGFRYYLVQF